MGSKSNAGSPLFLSLNLLFFVLVSTTSAKHRPRPTPSPPPPPSMPKSPPPPIRRPPPPSVPSSPPPRPTVPISRPPPPMVPISRPPPPSLGTPPPPPATCPIDALQLGACTNLLGGLVGIIIGTPPKAPCCSLLDGLTDLEAAICLCTAITVPVLGTIDFNVHLTINVLLSVCSKNVPPRFKCVV